MPRHKIQTCIIIEDSDDDVFLTAESFRRSRIDLRIRRYVSLNAYLADPANDDFNHTDEAIVIVDLVLAMSSGIDVIRTLRQRERERSMIMGVCSGSDDPSDKIDALAAGADFFTLKPLNLNALQAICESVAELDIERTSGDHVHLLRQRSGA